jgi:FkbM family methyltransferase
MNALRRLTYRSDLQTLARSLHLTEPLRKWYYRWAVSSEGVFRTRVNGIDVQLYTHTPEELRTIEGNFLLEKDFLVGLVANLGPGDVFYDVGSQIGQFVIPLAKVVGNQGQVIAFEPENSAYDRLIAHVGLNGLPNVRAFKQGLGDKNYSGRLFVGGAACPSLVLREGDAEQQRAAQAADIVQGDWLVRTEGLPIPRAVKIDVEGYEYSVLCGLQQTLAHPACKLLCCEIHPSFLPAGVDVTVIVEFVKSLGFTRIDTSPPHPRWPSLHMVAAKRESTHETR